MKLRLKVFLSGLLFFTTFFVWAQTTKNVVGTVTDSDGIALPGVNVIIKGTAIGSVTDFDGKYSVKADETSILVFSYLGYQTKEMLAVGKTSIDVQLVEDAESLNEVVVTALGIKRNPKSLGYAVSTVKSEEITENSEPDLVRSLAGKVPGVNVNFSTGVAGASNQINIRGATSIGTSTQPLIIVDGIAYSNIQRDTSNPTTGGGAYESAISTIDPNNIQSINVLKGATAAALYGSRATGGVIVITTKTGADINLGKKFQVDVSSGVYFENIANLPEYQNTYGNGVNFNYVNANGSWGPRFDSLETIPTWPNLLNAFPDQFEDTIPYEAQPDNVESLFRTGVVLDNSVSMSYNNEDGNFNVTASDLAQEGYIPFNSYDRTAFGVGGNYKFGEKLKIGGIINFTATEQNGPFLGNNQFTNSASSFARALWLGRTWDFSLPYTNPETGASVTPNSGYDHPLWSWENDTINTETNRMVANFNTSYAFNDHISASFRIGYNRYDFNRVQKREIGSRADEGLGSIRQDNGYDQNLETTFLLNFDYDLNEDFNFKAIVGQNAFRQEQDLLRMEGTEFKVPGIYTLENTLNVRTITNEGISDAGDLRFGRKSNVGVFGDVSLSYRNYAFLNATGRNDWSSTLPNNNNSYFYPSVNASLIFTEAFDFGGDVLTYGKIRGGFAAVGNDAPIEFLSAAFVSGDAVIGNSVIGNDESASDPDITPEFTREFEIGADLEFFNKRAVVDFTWYKKTTTDIISPITVPASSGFTEYNTNLGEMVNQGVEIGLTLVPIKTDNFMWTSFTTFTKNKNEVTELIDGLDRIQFDPNQVAYAIPGEAFGVFYGTKFARDEEGNFLINESTGGILEDPENGIIGDPNPDFRVGFINTFKYKNFTLSAQVDWKEGGDIQSISINSLLGRGVTKDTEDRERTFVIPGFYGDVNGNAILDDGGNKIANTTQIDTNELYFSPANSNTFGINTVDEGSVYDGTVYRLREISFGYELPKKFLENTPFNALSLTVLGNNLWYFAPNVPKYTNFDPEVTSFGSSRLQGIEVTTAPTSRRYGFRINASF